MISTHLVYVFFLSSMVLLISLGLLCAIKLDYRNPCWVRWIVLSPCLVALVTTYRLSTGNYVPYQEDVLFYIALAANYALIYSRFTGRAWLDIRTKEWVAEQSKTEAAK
jgi:hypothetical protein